MERMPSKNFQVGETVVSKKYGRGKVVRVLSWIINDFPIRVAFEGDHMDERSFMTTGKYFIAGPDEQHDIERA